MKKRVEITNDTNFAVFNVLKINRMLIQFKMIRIEQKKIHCSFHGSFKMVSLFKITTTD
jgi:uncharacterized Zn finger protein